MCQIFLSRSKITTEERLQRILRRRFIILIVYWDGHQSILSLIISFSKQIDNETILTRLKCWNKRSDWSILSNLLINLGKIIFTILFYFRRFFCIVRCVKALLILFLESKSIFLELIIWYTFKITYNYFYYNCHDVHQMNKNK